MRTISFITDLPVVVAILEHPELPHTPPPISLVFDQSLPDDFDN